MFVGAIAITTPNYKSAVFSEVYRTLITAINKVKKGRSEQSDATPFLTNKIALNII
jgi:hypothetical protein